MFLRCRAFLRCDSALQGVFYTAMLRCKAFLSCDFATFLEPKNTIPESKHTFSEPMHSFSEPRFASVCRATKCMSNQLRFS